MGLNAPVSNTEPILLLTQVVYLRQITGSMERKLLALLIANLLEFTDVKI